MAARVKWAVSILRVDVNTSLDRLGRKAVYLSDQKTANRKTGDWYICAGCLFFFYSRRDTQAVDAEWRPRCRCKYCVFYRREVLYTKDWSHRLDISDATVYRDAAPMIDMTVFTSLLHILRTKGYRVVVLTWLSKNADPDFHKNICIQKRQWLDRYGIPADDVIMMDYGMDKHQALMTKYPDARTVLFDDDARVRDSWKSGMTVDPVTCDINAVLAGLLTVERHAYHYHYE